MKGKQNVCFIARSLKREKVEKFVEQTKEVSLKMKKWLDAKLGWWSFFIGYPLVTGIISISPLILRFFNEPVNKFCSASALGCICLLWISFAFSSLFFIPHGIYHTIYLMLWLISYCIMFSEAQTIASYTYYALNIPLIFYYKDVLDEYFESAKETGTLFKNTSIYKLESFTRGLTFVLVIFAIIFPINEITNHKYITILIVFSIIAVIIGIVLFVFELYIEEIPMLIADFLKEHCPIFLWILGMVVSFLIVSAVVYLVYLVFPGIFPDDKNEYTNDHPSYYSFSDLPSVTVPDFDFELPHSLFP